MFEFNDLQLKQLAGFLSNLGLLFLGTSTITPLFAGFDKANLFMIILGLASTITCLILSLIILRETKNDRKS